MTRVLIVEDEPLQRQALALGLSEAGFDVAEAGDAAFCRHILQDRTFDIVVLDLGLPDQDGIALAAELRRRGDIGVLIVTRRAAPEARIEALDVGADDYLVKPVHLGELAARIRSVMRRRRPAGDTASRLGRWRVDLGARTVSDGEVDAGLTRGEFEIVRLLLAANGGVVSREAMLAAISRKPLDADLRSVDVLVSRIRRKLGAAEDGRDLILTVPGFGYQIGRVPPQSSAG